MLSNEENDCGEVTSNLSGERYAVIGRPINTSETTGIETENFTEFHPTLKETSSQNVKDINKEREDIGVYSDIDNEDTIEDELVLERLRSTSPIGQQSIEKPSLIPNESRFNAIEYLIGSLSMALDSLTFDKTLVIQSKMAGELNNSSNDVLKAIEEMEISLKEHIIKYNNLKNNIIPEIESNLRKGTKLANKLTAYVKKEYPIEYSKGKAKILDNLTEDEEGLYS
ncbi:KxDL motif-containing protein 1 [Pichia californica]|uniref:Biogenesis of lysosome-related organelles complex 1 subunit KXD1 n=1 Tax=Pichia californica TaxID=460514 RepID=A0A9P7BD49_9ASCO|nr:KxDL motif-containing protein 1 [[Candida] californica]KAG0686506.1 KxDL motif-containing protein 1 [[Candida] californica]